MLIDQPQSWLKASLGQGALQPTFVADRNVPIPVSQGWRKQSFNLVNEISKLTFVVAGQFLPTVQLLCRVRNCRTGAQKRLCESIESHRAPLQLDIHQDNANVKNKAAFVINLSHQLFRITGKFGHK